MSDLIESSPPLITDVVLVCEQCHQLSTPDPEFHNRCPFCGHRFENDEGWNERDVLGD